MKNPDSHIFLYAKNWYEKNDMIEDLRIIVGKRSGIEPEYIVVGDIYTVLVEVTLSHIIQKSNNVHYNFAKILDGLGESLRFNNSVHISTEKDMMENIISRCLSYLGNVRVFDNANKVLLELDEPDSNILPRIMFD